ncbi:MAG: Coenzyme F420 hydrogenase/dehydrogenase, beta subunit C-terminal domain [Clostridiales bacterium]|nr:Coenzyme F420 hydrogenase/dehydrogenase, beta subunit C-terminal domain [Clostridiales bacterium]
MISIVRKDACTGCAACYNTCNVNAIKMIPDEYGFLCPIVNESLCVKCKKCTTVCPVLNSKGNSENWIEPKVYAAWSLDKEVRYNSTSGGIFSELAIKILNENGLVVGARYNNLNLVEHDIISTIGELSFLRQSKYLQSEIGDVYKRIYLELEKGRLVSFCGSPCQVDGLQRFLGKKYPNLATFDFICRGTNSPKAYSRFLEMLELKYKSPVYNIWFKNKTYGWNRFSTRIEFENGKLYNRDRYHDLFMRGYIEENLYMRSCCFNCKYKNLPRVSNITLADFWGVGDYYSYLDDDKGTSLILINNEIGDMLFDKIKKNVFSQEMKLAHALKGNVSIFNSAEENANSKKFLLMLDNFAFDKSFKTCVKNYKLKQFKKKILRYFYKFKNKIKTLIKINLNTYTL